MADVMGGTAGGTVGEPFNRPLTAHFIGGCTIGATAESGVIDAYQRVYGHPGLHVADGSAITANLGVNPSLSITAQAERAMAFWPNKGDADPRPPLGSAYERVGPVTPPHQPSRRPLRRPSGCRWWTSREMRRLRPVPPVTTAPRASLDVWVRFCAPSLTGPCREGPYRPGAQGPAKPPSRPGPV
jgi:hypothetical protein